MRLVRFEDESGGFAVDLHPLITVISGLPAHVRERLVHGLAALPRGTDPGGRGSIEVHGVHLDLNRESLELLELNQDLDVILRASDLPGSEAHEDDAPFDDPYESAPAVGEDDEIRDARRSVQEQDEAYDAAVQAVEGYRAQLADIEHEQAALNRQLGDVRIGLDSFAAAGLKIAREELADLTTPVGAAAGSAGSGGRVGPPPSAASGHDAVSLRAERDRIEHRLDVLITESDRLKRAIKSLRAIDPAPVREAYAASGPAVTPTPSTPPASSASTGVAPPPEPELLPSAEAEALADEWEDLEARLAALGPIRDHGRERLDALTSQRDHAYDAMKLAERNLRSPELDPAAVDRLEAVHDEIFELDGRTSRFGAGKQRRRLEALRSEESVLLEQLGFDTWSSYIMGITSAGSDPARRREHENAVRAYELAETELAHAANEPVPVVDDPERDDLERALDDLSRRVVAFLGGDPDPDPVTALRSYRVASPAAVASDARDAFESTDPVEEPVTVPADVPVEVPAGAADALRAALEATGATMPDGDLSAPELRALAAGWLETMDELPERIARATAERDDIEAEISELAVALDALPAEAPEAADEVAEAVGNADPGAGDVPPPEETPELIEARERVAEAEARVRAHEEAVARIAAIENELERLGERAREVHRALAEREPRVASLLEQRVAARNRLRRAENNRSSLESARWENRHQSNPESSRLVGGSAGAEAVEWYVLARLAQQRSVSFVGSVPLVIDDAFVNWPVEALGDVFSRLERMGEVIQIVYLTDDPAVGSWARSLGADRALVLDMRVAS